MKKELEDFLIQEKISKRDSPSSPSKRRSIARNKTKKVTIKAETPYKNQVQFAAYRRNTAKFPNSSLTVTSYKDKDSTTCQTQSITNQNSFIPLQTQKIEINPPTKSKFQNASIEEEPENKYSRRKSKGAYTFKPLEFNKKKVAKAPPSNNFYSLNSELSPN